MGLFGQDCARWKTLKMRIRDTLANYEEDEMAEKQENMTDGSVYCGFISDGMKWYKCITR